MPMTRSAPMPSPSTRQESSPRMYFPMPPKSETMGQTRSAGASKVSVTVTMLMASDRSRDRDGPSPSRRVDLRSHRGARGPEPGVERGSPGDPLGHGLDGERRHGHRVQPQGTAAGGQALGVGIPVDQVVGDSGGQGPTGGGGAPPPPA